MSNNWLALETVQLAEEKPSLYTVRQLLNVVGAAKYGEHLRETSLTGEERLLAINTCSQIILGELFKGELKAKALNNENGKQYDVHTEVWGRADAGTLLAKEWLCYDAKIYDSIEAPFFREPNIICGWIYFDEQQTEQCLQRLSDKAENVSLLAGVGEKGLLTPTEKAIAAADEEQFRQAATATAERAAARFANDKRCLEPHTHTMIPMQDFRAHVLQYLQRTTDDPCHNHPELQGESEAAMLNLILDAVLRKLAERLYLIGIPTIRKGISIPTIEDEIINSRIFAIENIRMVFSPISRTDCFDKNQLRIGVDGTREWDCRWINISVCEDQVKKLFPLAGVDVVTNTQQNQPQLPLSDIARSPQSKGRAGYQPAKRLQTLTDLIERDGGVDCILKTDNKGRIINNTVIAERLWNELPKAERPECSRTIEGNLRSIRKTHVLSTQKRKKTRNK